mgnify:CR=1 FL=1
MHRRRLKATPILTPSRTPLTGYGILPYRRLPGAFWGWRWVSATLFTLTQICYLTYAFVPLHLALPRHQASRPGRRYLQAGWEPGSLDCGPKPSPATTRFSTFPRAKTCHRQRSCIKGISARNFFAQLSSKTGSGEARRLSSHDMGERRARRGQQQIGGTNVLPVATRAIQG